jgi:thiaminase
MDATSVIDQIRAELAPTERRLRTHPYVRAVEEGAFQLSALRPLVGEQHAIISSDLRSVAGLVSRTGDPFFLGVLDGERAALAALAPLAAALRLEQSELEAYEPEPGAHAYAAYMAWLGAYASPGEVAAAYLVNFPAWGEMCARMSRALRGRHGLSDEQVRFFDLFAEADPQFQPNALAVIQSSLDQGLPDRLVRRAARLLQGYEAMFWDALYMRLEGR